MPPKLWSFSNDKNKTLYVNIISQRKDSCLQFSVYYKYTNTLGHGYECPLFIRVVVSKESVQLYKHPVRINVYSLHLNWSLTFYFLVSI